MYVCIYIYIYIYSLLLVVLFLLIHRDGTGGPAEVQGRLQGLQLSMYSKLVKGNLAYFEVIQYILSKPSLSQPSKFLSMKNGSLEGLQVHWEPAASPRHASDAAPTYLSLSLSLSLYTYIYIYIYIYIYRFLSLSIYIYIDIIQLCVCIYIYI